MNEIKFSGQLTLTEFERIQHLLLRKAWLLVGTVLLAWTAFDLASRDFRTLFTDLYEFLSVGLPLIFFWLFWSSLYFIHRYFLRRYWNRNRLLHYPVTGVATDEGIAWDVENYMEFKFPWNLIQKYRSTKSLILVYTSTNQALFLPRRFFSNDTDWKSFQAILESKLPRK